VFPPTPQKKKKKKFLKKLTKKVIMLLLLPASTCLVIDVAFFLIKVKPLSIFNQKIAIIESSI
jgi:hypothetical protein